MYWTSLTLHPKNIKSCYSINFLDLKPRSYFNSMYLPWVILFYDPRNKHTYSNHNKTSQSSTVHTYKKPSHRYVFWFDLCTKFINNKKHAHWLKHIYIPMELFTHTHMYGLYFKHHMPYVWTSTTKSRHCAKHLTVRVMHVSAPIHYVHDLLAIDRAKFKTNIQTEDIDNKISTGQLLMHQYFYIRGHR